MTAAEILELVKALKESGVTHFKSGDLELSFGPQAQTARVITGPSVPLERQAIAEPDSEPPHVVQELKRLITATDEELIDRMFPLPKPEMDEITQ